jgi:hypothetical protein
LIKLVFVPLKNMERLSRCQKKPVATCCADLGLEIGCRRKGGKGSYEECSVLSSTLPIPQNP